MEGHCTPRCMASKMLIAGLILILVRKFTMWDIWIVIGVLMIIKAIMMYMMPVCKCQSDAEMPKKRR